LRIGFVGAGGVNFGSPEGPWDHASRLENLPNVTFTGIADPFVDFAKKQLEKRKNNSNSQISSKWSNCVVVDSFKKLIGLEGGKKLVDVVFIGLPPHAHGSTNAPSNIEILCAKQGVHMFIEKPLGVSAPEQVEEINKVISESGVIVAVGYMLRYSAAVEKALELLNGKKPVCVNAKYNAAYSRIHKKDWWSVKTSGGPVVEQGTHFADLIRYIGGEVDLSTIQAVSVPANCSIAKNLSEMPPLPGGEHNVPESERIPRCTSSSFKFESGAIGTLTHALLLHDQRYFTEIDIWADGIRVMIQDPYYDTKLVVRREHCNDEEEIPVPKIATGDDMYLKEVIAFIDAIRTNNPSKIRSLYSDSMKTYRLTYEIRTKAEQFENRSRL